MRKSLILAASLGTMIISSAAFAAALDATGVIKTIDAKANSITLVDGKTYGLPAGFAISTLKAGEKVSLVYDMKNSQMVATSVKAAN
jgi:Cu/Ag efflux protein CusF